MNDEVPRRDLGMGDRIRRSSGRGSRDRVANTRVTAVEQKELEAAARREGKAISEWGREVLLREARKGQGDTALFTEVVALRMLLTTVLRNLATGEAMTPDAFSQVVSEVKAFKHQVTRELLEQYRELIKENHA